MKLTDSVKKPTGRLAYSVYDNGCLIERVDESNLVVDGMRRVASLMLGGAGYPVTQIGVGTNGLAPDVGNTSLTGAYLKPISSVEHPSSTSVKFNFAFTISDANGIAIMEFGLVTTDAVLVARKVRAAALNKTSTVSFDGSWIIEF